MSDHNPCKGCTDRRPGDRATPPCHADCPRYAALSAECEERRAQRDKERILDSYACHSAAQHRAIKQEAQRRRRERTRR